MTDGLLVIDKPAGMTSHDVVDVIRKRFKTKKVGHAGTLDPDATGVLLVGVGKATRFLAYAQDAPKRYLATARFGTSTTTQDASGDVIETRPATFSKDELSLALEKFTGSIEQIPPMVSAVKIGGEALHVKARRGETVERAARPVTVHELTLVDFRDRDVPEADLDVLCSSGTYIRTLINDVGEVLGSGAHMATLRRTETGGFTLAEATPLEDITTDHLLDLAETVRVLPVADLGADHAADVSFGRQLPADVAPEVSEDGLVAVKAEGRLLAVYKRTGDRLAADRVVPS
jgi:tRNA pseudouridine55 synthase